jgi:Ca2+-binding RTX toxin-like protein
MGNGDDFGIGGEGEDTVEGGEGADELHGHEGNDLLDGGEGNDLLFGDEGSDRIVLGSGDDFALGGLDNDTFVIAAGMEGERIGDFTGGLGASDVIEFHGLGISTFTELQTYMSEWEGSTYIDFDENNFIVLEGVIMSSLSQDDFVFV